MTLTKRDLVVQITEELNRELESPAKDETQERPGGETAPGGRGPNRLPFQQREVFDVVQKTLDHITRALTEGQKVELRNFGVFEVRVRKARVGRNPNAPSTDVPIPARAVVKFKSGKEMRAGVLKLPTKTSAAAPKPPGQK